VEEGEYGGKMRLIETILRKEGRGIGEDKGE
jgi:hypothetical protein